MTGLGGNDAFWNGHLRITLGPPGTPRTATLDGAFSAASGDRSVAMSFNAAPAVLE